MKRLRTFAFCLLPFALLLGCASQRIDLSETLTTPDGLTWTKSSSLRARTFLDATNELARARTSNTDKTQSIGVTALEQESSGTNVVPIVESVVKGVVEGLKK